MKKKSQMKVINTYSIRKCNIGVASFIIGSFLFLGVNGNLAEANDERQEVNNGQQQKLNEANNERQEVNNGQQQKLNEANNERQEVDNGQQQKLNEANNERQEVNNGQQQKLNEANNERQEVDNGQQQKLNEANNERQEVNNGQQQKLNEANNERQEVNNGQQQKLNEANNERQEVDNGQQQKLNEANNERQEVNNGQQQKLNEANNERQEVDNGQQQKLNEANNERQEVNNGQQELLKKINESTNRESTVKRLLEDVYSTEDARGILNKIKPEDYNLSSKELINKIIKAGIDYSEENSSKYKVFASVPRANITLKSEYNIDNSLVVRSDKVIKPEDYVNYPEGYHVQSYISKGKEYPSLDDIVKKRVTGSYKITYRLLDSKDEPVYGEDGQAIVRSLNVYFYNPEPALDIIKEIEEDIDENNYQNGEEIKEDLEKIKNELERPTKIPDVPASIDEINNKKNQLGNLDTTAPDAPTVTNPQPGDKVITGTAEPNGTVDVTLPNGDVIKDVPVNADGNYTADVPEDVELKEGDKVTVVAKDGNGNTSTPVEGTVTDTVAPDAPTVTNPQPGDKVITGTAEPNGTVDVTLPNGDVIKDVPVNADGNYTADVPEDVELKEGDKVTVVAKDGNGNTSTPVEGTVTDTVAPDAPTVTNPQPGDKVITGTAEPNGTVDVTLPNGDVIKDVPVNADGNYTADVPEDVELKEGDKVTVVAKDGNGNTSTPVEGTVTDTVAPDAPTVTNPQPGDKVITGTAEPNGTVDVTLPNGDVIKDVPVNADGNYTADVPEDVELKEGDKVTVVAKDGNGNTSTPVEGTVTDTVAPDAPTVTNPQPGDKVITGTAEPNGTVDVTLPNGDVIKDVPVNADGNYTADVPEDVELKEGDKVTVVAKDGNGNTSTPVEGTVTDTVAPDAPTVTNPQPGDKVITGTAEPNGTVDVTLPNGDVIKDVPVNADGNYTADVPEDVELKEGDKVTVVAKDGNGNTSTPVEGTVTDTVAPDAPTVTNPQPGDKVITGTAEPNGTVDVTLPNGDVIKDVPVNADGNYTADVPEDVELKEGDKVTVVAKDGNGNTSTPVEGTVTDTVAPDAPTVTNPQPGDKVITGTAEPNGTVDVTLPNGDVIKDVPVNADGNYTADVPEDVELKEGDKVTVVAKDGNGNTSTPVEGTVTDTVAPDAPTVTNPQPGDKVITGTAEPNGTVDVTLPNGDVIKDVPVNADGNYTADVPEDVELKEGDKVTVVAKDGNGNTSTPVEGTVTDTVAPDAPTVTNPQPGDKVITGTAEPNGTVDVTLPNGDVIKDVPVNADGNYTADVPEDVELKEGDKVTVVAKDGNGNTSTPVEGTVTDTVAPDAPTVTNPQPGDKVITGTAEPNGTVDVTLPNGDVIKDVPVNADGNYTADVPEDVELKEGDKVTVVAKDGNGNTSTPVEGTVTDTVAPDAPTVTNPQPGDKVITGTAEPNGTVDVTLPNGDVIKDVPVNADGNYTADVPEDVELKEGDKVTVVAKDGNGNTSTPVEGTVTDTVAPDAPTVTNPQPGDKVITGTAEPNGTVDVTLPNGDVIKDVPVNADGNYTADVPEDVELKEGDKVTVVAKDGNGNTSTPVEGTVTDTVAPDAPTVTNPQPGDKVITGTAEPNGTVDVTLPNGDVIKDVPVNADGNYTADVPEDVELKEGDKVTVVAKDGNGNTSTPVEGTVTDTVAPDAPTVTNPQPGDKVITGTAEPNGTVDVTLPNGDVIKDVPVNADGNYTADVPEDVELKEGDKVTVVAKDGNGNTSTPVEGTVTDTVAPDAPTVTNPQPGDKVITGTAEPNGTVDVTLPNGDVIKDVPVNADGNYTADVPEDVELKEGDKVTVVAKDGNGNTSTPVEGTVTDTVAPDAPTVTNPQPGDKVITGTAEPNGTVDVTLPNGDVIKDVPVNADGNYTADVPEDVELKEGDKVTVVAKDGNGNTSTPVEGTVTDTVAPDAPTVTNPQPGDKVITGTAEPNGTVDVTLPNGDVIKDVPVNADGNYTADVPEDVELKEGDKVTVVAKDGNGNTSTPVEGTVTDTVAPDAPTVTNPQPGDKVITGTAEPNGTVDVTLPNGDVIKDVPVNADGNYTADVPEDVELKEGDKVTVVAKDGNGNTSTPVEGTVTDTVAPDAPTVTNPQPGDKVITGTAEPNGTVDVTLPNGDVIKDVPVNADGNYTADVPEDVELKEGDKVTVVAKDGNGNTSTPVEGTVTDTVAPDAPTVTNPQPGDKVITGTAEPNGTVDVTLPNGDVIKDVPVNADGNYTADVPEDVELKEGDKVTVVAKDGNGNTSTPVEGTVTDTVAPDAPTVTNPQPGDKVITGTAEPNGTVDVTLPNGDVIKDVPVNADGNYTADVPEDVELKEGDKVTVVAKDGNGNTSTPVEGTVTDTVAPDAPTVTNPQPGDKVITGTAEPNGTVDVTLPNGDVIKDVPVNADGNYTADVPEDVELKEGDKVTVVAKDGNGNTSTPVEGTVTDTVAPDAPTVTNPQPGDKVITGTAEPNGTVDVTLPNGDVIKDVPVNADGNYTADVPEDVELKEGDKVTVVAKDGNGNTSTPVEGTVTDTVAPDAPTVTNPQPGDKVITGTAEPNGTVDVTLPNGDVIKDVPVNADGNYTADVPEDVELKEGDKVTVVAKDGNGNTSTPVEGTVTDTVAPDAPTVDPVQAGDKEVTGKGEPGSEITVKFPDGKEGTTTVDKDGNWTVKVPEGTTIKPGDKLIVTATDEAGNTSEPTVVVVPDEKSDDNTGKSGNTGMTGKTGNTSNTDNSNAGDMGNMDATPAVKGDMSEAKDMNNNGKEVNELPETGNESTNAPLFGSLIAALGSLFLLGRRRKENEEK